jgi:hypothetical protein
MFDKGTGLNGYLAMASALGDLVLLRVFFLIGRLVLGRLELLRVFVFRVFAIYDQKGEDL